MTSLTPEQQDELRMRLSVNNPRCRSHQERDFPDTAYPNADLSYRAWKCIPLVDVPVLALLFPDTGETPEEPDEATCAVCGRDIFRPWIDGIQEPWKHWVEPLDHPAALRAIPSGDRLDVERLAAAMHAAGESIGADPATPQLYPSDASLIAAEYARLAATEPEEGRDA